MTSAKRNGDPGVSSSTSTAPDQTDYSQIEAELLLHPEVAAVSVALAPGRTGEPRLVAQIVPRSGSDGQPGSARIVAGADHARSWSTLFDALYVSSTCEDPKFNVAGWNSSYTNGRLPREHLVEWRDRTIEAIEALSPEKVLEIGCGTGILLHGLAPRTKAYVGTDLAGAAVRLTADQVDLPHVSLLHQAADVFDTLPEAFFDTVILNSVVQYFPCPDYLLRVISSSLRATARPAALFLGDLRDLRLREAFHLSVELNSAPDSMPLETFQRNVEQRVAMDDEMCIDPRWFGVVCEAIPGSHVSASLERGRFLNEMIRFRYHAVVRIGDDPDEASGGQHLNWTSGQGLEWLGQLLEESPDRLTMHGIPNGRVSEYVTALRILPRLAGAEVGDLRHELRRTTTAAENPEAVAELARRHRRRAAIGCGSDDEGLTFDVTFHSQSGAPQIRPTAQRLSHATTTREHREEASGDNGSRVDVLDTLSRNRGSWSHFVSDPLAARLRRDLPRRLRDHLRAGLSQHRLPSLIMLVDALPGEARS